MNRALQAAAAATLAVCTLGGAPAAAPVPQLTLDSVFAKEPLWGRTFDRIAWSPDGRWFLYVRSSQDSSQPTPLMLYDARRGTAREWLPANAFGTRAPAPAVAGWSFDGSFVALVSSGTLYVAPAASPALRKIADDVDDAVWSPHDLALAYARRSDLYVARPPATAAQRLTTGGSADILNGSLDWVYPEELGIKHGFAWSSDGRSIAYLRMDERPVTNFPIADFLTSDNRVEYQRYPLAGERNPRVSLRLASLDGRSDRLIYDAGRSDEYIAAFAFLPHSAAPVAEIVDRRQQTMRVDAFEGAARTLYRQHASSWVDVQPLPVWLPGGRSIWLLDRAGTAGIYLRARDGSLRRLGGKFRVLELDGASPRGTAYVLAAYPTRRDRALLAIGLDGSVRNLTPSPGWHAVALAPTFDRFVDTHSRLDDPPQVDLVSTASGSAPLTLLAENVGLKTALLHTAMLEVPSPYGPLDATMLQPPGFDPAKKYPVVMYVYGGPDAPTTADRFGGLYHQLLARAGAIVFSIDGPASQVDSDEHVRLLLRNFGPGSLLGQEIGARYLATLPYVDPARIGIWGWSFGGYETCYALTHSALFKAGAAVAPVTDWHLYDSIYTERYMGLPSPNAGAYARSSVLGAADHLNGPLLIQHGTADDNVHMANTMQLIQRFILAHQSQVLFYPYPRKTHGIRGLPQQRSVFAHMLDFWKTQLSL